MPMSSRSSGCRRRRTQAQPISQARVLYARRWSGGIDPAAGSAPETAAFLAAEYREYLTALVVDRDRRTDLGAIPTLLARRDDAGSLANLIFAEYGVTRRLFRVRTGVDVHDIKLGMLVSLRFLRFPRFDLEQGALFRIVAVDFDPNTFQADLTLWG